MVQDEIPPGYASAGSCAARSTAAAGAVGSCPLIRGQLPTALMPRAYLGLSPARL
jgi:hypothetical protein